MIGGEFVVEILLRGKRIDNNEWIEGYVYRIAEHLEPFIMLKNSFACSYEVKENTVGQFTGQNDKSGNKLFDGDVFCTEDKSYVIKYDKDNTEFVAIEFSNGMIQKKSRLSDFPKWKVMKIGNVHDNPELLLN